MTPAARHAAAIIILDRVFAGEPATKAMTSWGRGNRFAGSGDRAAIADLVYHAIRCRRSFGYLAGGDAPRDLILGLTRAIGSTEDVFTGVGHAPPVLDSDESGRTVPDLAVAPKAVRLNYPDWLGDALEDSLSDDLDSVMEALCTRAPLDLRVNRLKSDRARAQARLKAGGIETTALSQDEDALRVMSGERRVHRSEPYLEGAVEIQDLSSQMVSRLAADGPCETILDYCAGGGGKSLALASLTGGTARITAHDSDAGRLAQLDERADRAGARIEPRTHVPEDERFDLVLVDAPCSGSGAWRRNPQSKWTLTRERLAELCDQQARILDRAARYVRPGGRLVYVTCSLLRAENEMQSARFRADNPAFVAGEERRLFPPLHGDGFYLSENVNN